ncbi:MAG: GNAT family N-acetyltransferase [Chloroflexi bacterium]|nr:GNAT family N-acetyltransferase [Chloroflexota bacterium]
MSEETKLPGRDADITLKEITKETARSILNLKVADEQKNFVADNATSIAQAHFEPKAWFRAIYADETPVGFIMLFDDAEEKTYFLWRLMVDAKFQGMGYGRYAVQHLIDYVKTRPSATELLVSYMPGEGSPKHFYTKLGFENTGKKYGEEFEMKLTL